jgi:3-oxoacyl-[acyl-carrier-protein] synthase-1
LQPLRITHVTLASSLGAGLSATLEALQARRSGLARCAFETVDLQTYAGEVPEAVLAPVREDLAIFDARNNRLAQLALRQDGFEDAVAAARTRYGPGRIGLFLGTSTSGLLETEQAYRRRDPTSGTRRATTPTRWRRSCRPSWGSPGPPWSYPPPAHRARKSSATRRA